jgi:hypothetical protein
MAWLGTWANRRKITIHNTNVDDNVTHYPLPVFLGTSVGIGADDVSDIFDEVGANSKKIAFTKDDGITELYAEIDYWDDSSEIAVFWVSKSDWTIDSTSDTEIYIYYDNTEADNTTYVNTTDSTAAISVWDDNYIGVWHLGLLGSDGTPGEFKDSSGTGNHGTGSGFPTQIDGKIGKAQDFDGSSDELDLGNATQGSSLDLTERLTLSAWIRSDKSGASANQDIIGRDGIDKRQYNMHITGEVTDVGVLKAYLAGDTAVGTTDLNSGGTTWYYAAITWDKDVASGEFKVYVNATEENSGTRSTALPSYAQENEIGHRTGKNWNGGIDEARISDIDRGVDWLKVDYYSQDDNILTWSAAEHRGWVGGDVNTITNANVGKVNSVSKVDIAKINTV